MTSARFPIGVATRYKQGRSIATLEAGTGMNDNMVTGTYSWDRQGWRWLWILGIIAAGCAQPQPLPATSPSPTTPLALAQQQLASGDFAGAAAAFSQLAETAAEPAATTLRNQASLIRLDLGEALASAPTTGQPALLSAGMQALAAQQAGPALAALLPIQTATLDPYERGLYLRTLGRAQLLNGDAQPAAINLTLAERYPLPAKRRTELTYAIWAALTQSGLGALTGQLKPEAPQAAGWLALLDLVGRTSSNPVEFASQLGVWQSTYPHHPAQLLLIDELLEKAEEGQSPVRRIALVLPFEGPLGKVAIAIRDGFIAARFAQTSSDSKPDVVVYPASVATTAAVIKLAVSEGADFIVGPLEKPAVAALLAQSELHVPVLALNTTEHATDPSRAFYQFGLQPEDEARDVAEHAWQQGARRAIAMVPNSDLGSRLLGAFRTQWAAQGGAMVEAVRYTHDVSSYKEAVRRTFGLAESEARAQALAGVVRREIAFDAVRRNDVDAVFLVAAPRDARQLLPQFRYYGADGVPIYATPLIYSGVLNPRADTDLNGVFFGDSSWSLNVGDLSLRDTFLQQWEVDPAYLRFYGFGVDAWHLIAQLRTLRGQAIQTLEGASGTLSVDTGGVVHRSLKWASFINGKPRLLEP